MNQHILAKELLKYIKGLDIDERLDEWIFKGKTDITYGSPNGGWNGINGFLFIKKDKSHSYVIRSVPKESTSSYIVVESINLKGQLYNMDLSNPKICKEDHGQTYLLESYRMTVGKGKKKEKDVEDSFKSFNVNTNEITAINDINPNWSKTLTDILEWGILREKVKAQLKGNKISDKRINLKDKFIDWIIKNETGGNYFINQFGSQKVLLEKELDEYESIYKDTFQKELFILSIKSNLTQIGVIKDNIYDKSTSFYRYNKGHFSGRPSAILGSKNYLRFLNEYFLIDQTMESKIVDNQFPLNQILYGPPGTGKTYHTVLEAAKIVTGNESITYDEALKVFNENLGTQIEFITFHQNYSYEDFIQGLRPDTGNGTALTFEKKDGVFKRIADRAMENLNLASKAPEELSNELSFDKALEAFKDSILDTEDKYAINDSVFIFEIDEEAFRYTGTNWEKHSNGIRMKFSDLKEFYRNDVQTRKDIKALTTVSGLANQHATYYLLVYQAILKFLPSQLEQQVQIQRKNYVIIIDEINRANISRVFGELITLIEEDKRSHGKIPMRVTLPSGDTFIVPSNLYLIGTMNTADKSIALLDIALRRRFEFVPMYPDATLDSVNNKDILTAINTAILQRKSHDFTIGHAYFMVENFDLEKTINHKVIPLLLEYFMNDEKEVIAILKEANLTVGSWPLKVL